MIMMYDLCLHCSHSTGTRAIVMYITVNVLKFQTLDYFSAVCNFRNYVSEKVLVFEILECGLYHEHKRYIYTCKNVLKHNMMLHYLDLLIFLFSNLIKTAA